MATLLFSLDYQQVAKSLLDDDGGAPEHAFLSATLSREFITMADRIWGHDA
jgi:hypothetical protein